MTIPRFQSIQPAPEPGNVGYSVQAWISRWVQDLIRGGQSYRTHISTQFSVVLDENVAVGDSANPFMIFRTLDNAVKTKDINNDKVQRLKQSLRSAVSTSPLDRRIARGAITTIDTAEVSLFSPELWIIDLDSVSDSRREPGQYPHEFLVDDLAPNQFDAFRFR